MPATLGRSERREGRVNLLFDFFSLDFVYYPVSWIMWVWYKLFASMLGPSNFFAWALSVMFLVFSLRALLYKPFVRQIRTTRQPFLARYFSRTLSRIRSASVLWVAPSTSTTSIAETQAKSAMPIGC